MMGLFSRPLMCIRLLIVCLGSWEMLGQSTYAQEISAETVAGKTGAEHLVLDTLTSPNRPGIWLERLNNNEPFIEADTLTISDSISISDNLISTKRIGKKPIGLCVCETPPIQTRGYGSSIISSDVDEDDEHSPVRQQQTDADDSDGFVDDELGILRLRSQPIGLDSELGILRIRPTEDVPLEVEPEPTRQTTVFLTGRANVYGGNNLFRTPEPIDDRIYQTGIGVFAFPRISDSTNLVLSAEANLARYEDLSIVDYNELQFQAGIRQRLSKNSYGQLNWRYQDLITPGNDSFFTANYVELLLSRRDILNNRTWLDTYYQARLSVSDPKAFSRFTQIATGSLNYGFDPQTRISLLYQLFIDDYTEIPRHDTYHQILAQLSHDLSSTTRVSLFTGVRFGRSSLSAVDFDDTIYGASLNISVPLF